jgi:hypothetical protein
MKRPLIFLLSVIPLAISTILVAMDSMDLSNAYIDLTTTTNSPQININPRALAEFDFILHFNRALYDQNKDKDIIDDFQKAVSNKNLSSEFIYKKIKETRLDGKDVTEKQQRIIFLTIARVRPYLPYQIHNKRPVPLDHALIWLNFKFIIPSVLVKDNNNECCENPWIALFIDAIDKREKVDINFETITFWLGSGYNPHYKLIFHDKSTSLNLHDMIIFRMQCSNTQIKLLNCYNEAIKDRSETEKKDTTSMFYEDSPFHYAKCGKPYEQ